MKTSQKITLGSTGGVGISITPPIGFRARIISVIAAYNAGVTTGDQMQVILTASSQVMWRIAVPIPTASGIASFTLGMSHVELRAINTSTATGNTTYFASNPCSGLPDFWWTGTTMLLAASPDGATPTTTSVQYELEPEQ